MSFVADEHPEAQTASTERKDVRTREHDLLRQEVRHRMLEIIREYGLEWLKRPFREESISAEWRAEFKEREQEFMARLDGVDAASLHFTRSK